jgi:cytochrome P450
VLYEGKTMESLFSTRNAEYHKALKRPVAQKFSMSSVRSLEPLVNDCTQIFINIMQELAGQTLDLDEWLQWYAFDAIYAMTFSKPAGFLEQRRDVSGILTGMDWILKYCALVGQVPWLHALIDPVLKAAMRMRLFDMGPLMIVSGMIEKALEEYDRAPPEEVLGRQDFLAYLRQQSKTTGDVMPRAELWNHLINNLLAGSDTTAMSLRAVFYYVVRDPRIYTQLQQEIDHADAERKLSEYITYTESLELPYL